MTAETDTAGSGTPPPEADPSGRLADNIVYFARVLRNAGLPVGPAAVVDAIRAVEVAGIASRDDFFWTLHSIFVKKREHRPVFDEAFRMFWRSRGLIEKLIALFSPTAPPRPSKEKAKAGAARVAKALFEGLENPTEVKKPEIEIDATLTVSGREVLQKKDFAQMSADEIADAKRALADLVLPLDKVRTRRLVPTSRGKRIDPRRSLRSSMRAGGDIIALRRRDPDEQPPPIVAICDISGSMSQYSRIFLHFLHALTEHRRRVHTFLFGTRLSNVTRQLRMKDPDQALDACTDQVEDWSGGTRIATALHDFNRLWSRRVLSGGPVVLLITDGLERDSDEDLAREMDRLHRSCRRLIWLNPLLRFEGFEPRARGVRAMLPHVDEFRAVHSLGAIADLCAALSGKAGREDTEPRAWLSRAG